MQCAPEAARRDLRDRVHKHPSGKCVPQRFLPTTRCQWAAWMLLRVGQYHTQAVCTPHKSCGLGASITAGQEMCQNENVSRPDHAASPDQHIHLLHREIVTLVSKVMIIFAPFHLFDAAAVSIPAHRVISLCRLGCSGDCKADFSSLLIC